MSIPKTPIMLDDNDEFEDADGNILRSRDIARDLTEFYEMKRRQDECDHTYFTTFVVSGVLHSRNDFKRYESPHCPKCGAYLSKIES